MTTPEIDELKRRVGRQPFESRLQLNNDFCACPFHNGDSGTSMHLVQKDGLWIATCFSACNKKWDALAFVMQKDNVDFAQACKRLGALPADTRQAKPKPKPVPMTEERWKAWGREIEQVDVDEFAKSRPYSHTASLATFRVLGVRIKDVYLGFPYVRTVDIRRVFSGVKMRRQNAKEFIFGNAVDTATFFNLDAVSPLEDVYIVEGEPDVATMAEFGLIAVSPFSAQQQKFNPDALRTLALAPHIFIIGDQDEPGQAFCERLQKLLPPDKTFRIKLPDAKDVGELAKKLGPEFPSRIQQLADEALIPPTPWVIENLPPIHKIPDAPKLWLADRLFLYGGLNLLSGRQGAMKSFLSLLFGNSLSGGDIEFLGRKILCPFEIGDGAYLNKPKPRVLYIDRENPACEVQERRRMLGIVGNVDLIYWGDWSEDPIPDDPLDPRLVAFAKSGGFIIFDSLQDWLGEANENSTHEMLALMNKFRHLARIGAGVLLLHHHNKVDRKTGQSQTRGSTVIVAVTDMAIQVSKRDDGILELRRDRFRMCGEWEMDVQPHFGATFHYFEVIRDEDASASAMRRKKEAEEKHKEKRSEKYEEEADDRNRLISEVMKNPELSARTLEEKTGISRKRAVRLLGEARWTWQGDKWVRDEIGTPENDLPF